MPDRDPAAIAAFVGLAADILGLHPLGALAEIEMHVDVDVVGDGDLEDAVDLAARVAVDVGRGTQHAGAAAQALEQQRLGAGVVQQALLREDADLDVDRPGVVARERRDAVEAAHADDRIDLDMGAHAHGAVADAALERAPATRIDVGLGEAVLGPRGFAHGLGDRALGGLAAVEDAGLVEMDVGLDEPGTTSRPSASSVGASQASGPLDRDDAAAGDAESAASSRPCSRARRMTRSIASPSDARERGTRPGRAEAAARRRLTG